MTRKRVEAVKRLLLILGLVLLPHSAQADWRFVEIPSGVYQCTSDLDSCMNEATGDSLIDLRDSVCVLSTSGKWRVYTETLWLYGERLHSVRPILVDSTTKTILMRTWVWVPKSPLTYQSVTHARHMMLETIKEAEKGKAK
jgi:hypothetical protein